jgi:hypothetical protein
VCELTVDKARLLAELESGFSGLLDSVEGLTDQQMLIVWLGDWSVRDILAHVAGWHREMAKAFDRIGRGERPVPEDVDYSNFHSWNANFASDSRRVSPEEVLVELKASQKAFAAAAAAVPEDRFEEGRAAHRIIHTTGIEHYAEHEPAIREWRRSQGI